uniref:Uncharacterized protein n=1 Tax=Anguilla anguilla TaxID=7936 RepID=A0A0E9UVA4_ANGAN
MLDSLSCVLKNRAQAEKPKKQRLLKIPTCSSSPEFAETLQYL